MKKLLTIMTSFMVTTPTFANVIACSEPESASLEYFYYLNLSEINETNATEKLEEAFIGFKSVKANEDSADGFRWASSIMNLWSLYGVIINDQFKASIDFDALNEKYNGVFVWTQFKGDLTIRENFEAYYQWRVIDGQGIIDEIMPFAQQVKKDYETVFPK